VLNDFLRVVCAFKLFRSRTHLVPFCKEPPLKSLCRKRSRGIGPPWRQLRFRSCPVVAVRETPSFGDFIETPRFVQEFFFFFCLLVVISFFSPFGLPWIPIAFLRGLSPLFPEFLFCYLEGLCLSLEGVIREVGPPFPFPFSPIPGFLHLFFEDCFHPWLCPAPSHHHARFLKARFGLHPRRLFFPSVFFFLFSLVFLFSFFGWFAPRCPIINLITFCVLPYFLKRFLGRYLYARGSLNWQMNLSPSFFDERFSLLFLKGSRLLLGLFFLQATFIGGLISPFGVPPPPS